MNTKYLQEFVALAESGNYWQTSGDLFISQSALSKHIMALEKELNIQLFNRTTRKVKLTADGELFLSYALKINQLLGEYAAVCETRKKTEHNSISIASTTQMTHYSVITDALAHYKRQHLDCTLNIITEPHRNLKKLLLQNKVDFIWIGEPEEETNEDDFTRIPFLEEPLVAVSPSKNLPAHEPLRLSDLAGQELIIQDNSSIEQHVFLQFCQKYGVFPKISSLPGASIMDFVKRELGVAIMLRSVAETVSGPELAIAEIENSPIVRVSLLHLKNAKLSPSARNFLNYLEG